MVAVLYPGSFASRTVLDVAPWRRVELELQLFDRPVLEISGMSLDSGPAKAIDSGAL